MPLMESSFASSLDNILRDLYYNQSLGGCDSYSLDGNGVCYFPEAIHYLLERGYVEEPTPQNFKLTRSGKAFCQTNSFCCAGKPIVY